MLFHMLVGLPGSGKTYYANNCISKKENTTILSSDEIRKVLLGSEEAQWGNSIVFDAMNRAAIENLKQGRDVIYDATNISSKRRMVLLDQIKKEVKEDIFFVATISATPYEICVKRQQKRERKVPEEVINRMIKNFEVPYYEEGWNAIITKYSYFNKDSYYMTGDDFFKKYIDYDQNNPYHNSTLGMHIKDTIERYNELVESNKVEYCKLINDALVFHDFGKPFCRTTDENGISHYYNHNNVGAYLFLCNLYSLPLLERERINVAKLIEWHMLELTEKALKRRRIENTDYPQMLKIIQECDKYRKS